MEREQSSSFVVYLWRIPERIPDALVASYRRDDSPDRFVFREAKSLSAELPAAHFGFNGTATDLAGLDCLPNDAQLPVAGRRAREVFE